MAFRTLWHSELVAAGETEVTMICNGPKPSKFSNKPEVMQMRMNGEDRLYNLESPDCGKDLSGYQGRTIRILAEGREGDAKITVLEEASAQRDTRTSTQPPPRSAPAARPPAREQAPREPARSEPPRRMTKEDREAVEWDAFKKTSRRAKQMGVMMHLCLQQASNCAADTKGALTNEDVRQLAITLFIELKGRTDLDALPIEVPTGAPKPAQPPPRQPDPPQREPDARDYDEREPAGRRVPGWAENPDGSTDDVPW